MAATTEHGERVYINPGEGIIRNGERIAAIESQLETERRHLATRADMERMASTLTWRMILIGAIFQAIGIGAIKYLP